MSEIEQSTMTQRVHEYADENEATMLLCEPKSLYDPAILGVVEGIEGGPRVAYSMQKMIECLAGSMATAGAEVGEDPDEHDYEAEAREFLDFNTFNAYVGPEGPIYINDLSDRV